jgi:hypothetical protein
MLSILKGPLSGPPISFFSSIVTVFPLSVQPAEKRSKRFMPPAAVPCVGVLFEPVFYRWAPRCRLRFPFRERHTHRGERRLPFLFLLAQKRSPHHEHGRGHENHNTSLITMIVHYAVLRGGPASMEAIMKIRLPGTKAQSLILL